MAGMRLAAAASLLVAVVVAVAAGWSSANGAGGDASQWLVISSTRDGGEYAVVDGQAYSVRPDGSRLTSLLGHESRLSPLEVSPDGRLIAYADYDSNAVYASRADGSGLRRLLPPSRVPGLGSLTFSPDGSTVAVARYDGDDHPHLFVVDADGGHVRRVGRAGPPDWSPDGSLVTFHTQRGCVVATADFSAELTRIRALCGYPTFSPDDGSVVFQTGSRCAVAMAPLPGRLVLLATAPRLLPGSCHGPAWSPDGRWIAYLRPGCAFCDSAKATRAARRALGVWVVHPDGSGRRRVGPASEEDGAEYTWSPDSSRLAIASGSRLVLASLAGRPRRIGPTLASSSGALPLWSADGSRLTMAAQTGDDPAQIWSIRADGTDLRRVTSAGVNDLVGFVHGSPARRAAPPLEPSERVLGPRLLETKQPIDRLAADGASVAYIAGSTETDCEHVSVWTPSSARILRVSYRLPAPCDDDYDNETSVYELALAGSMVGWSTNLGCGNSGCGVDVHTARLPGANPVEAGFDDGTDYGNQVLRPFDPLGRGPVFAVESRVRVEGPDGSVRRCHLPGHATADAVDGGRLAVRGAGRELIVDDHCRVVARVPLETRRLQTVLLDGSRLVAARAGSLEIYDASTGGLLQQRPLLPGTVLDGSAGGVAVLRHGAVVTALRLGDGRAVTFTLCAGPVRAAIGSAGLYYSFRTPEREGRLVLVPRQELERRLASGRLYAPRCLRSAQTFATGSGPDVLGAGDLDGDGRTDLVTGNEGGRSITVLQGPDFTARQEYPLRGYPASLALTDLDRDGRLDVAVTLGGANAVAVLRNRGDGTLALPRRYRSGRGPNALAAGDLDGDGAPDLVAANTLGETVSIFLNRGDGILRRRQVRATGSAATSLAIADVSGNGNADLVVGHGAGPDFVILEGAGDGTFPRARSFPIPEDTGAVTVADLDGKGRPDLVIVGCGPAVMLARAGGGFSRPRELPGDDGSCRSPAVSAGDLNGDGRLDLVTTTSSYGLPSRLAVYLNRRGGRFAAAGGYDAAGSNITPPTALIRDLNGDGRAELAVPVLGPSAVAVLTNTLGMCRVHDLGGVSVAAAARRLARAGCRIGHVRRVRAERAGRGRVVTAVPRFGAFWPNGPEVDLLVSR
jgi:FG-GAP-like repeat/WD40-like Beta Propeller Repeat